MDGFLPRTVTGENLTACIVSWGTVLLLTALVSKSSGSFWRSASSANRRATGSGLPGVTAAVARIMRQWSLADTVLVWLLFWTSSLEAHCLCCSCREWRLDDWSARTTSAAAWRLFRRLGFSRLYYSITSGEPMRCSQKSPLHKAISLRSLVDCCSSRTALSWL